MKLRWNHCKTCTISEQGEKFSVLELNVDRFKTSVVKTTPDDILHFVHASDFYKCQIFNMFFHKVISVFSESLNSTSNDNFMFPRWESFVQIMDEGSLNSKASEPFKKMWKKMLKTIAKYTQFIEMYEEANIDLSEDEARELKHLLQQTDLTKERASHCAKNLGLDILGNSMILPVQVSHKIMIIVNLRLSSIYIYR